MSKKKKKNKTKGENPEHSEENKTHVNLEKKTVVILGDSIVKNVQGWKLPNNSSSKSLVKAFPGAKVDDIFHYVKPTLIHHPDEIIIHVGTNDVKHSSPKTIAEHITDLGKCIVADSPETKVSISSLLCRSDDHSLDMKVKEVNKHLSTFASQSGWKFISHSNISGVHLNASGLHLNRLGTETLLNNFTKHIHDNWLVDSPLSAFADVSNGRIHPSLSLGRSP